MESNCGQRFLHSRSVDLLWVEALRRVVLHGPLDSTRADRWNCELREWTMDEPNRTKSNDVVDGFFTGKRYLIHDRDPLYTKEFLASLADSGIQSVKLPPRSPNLNAFAERFVRTIKESCLEQMIFFGEDSAKCNSRFRCTFSYRTEPSRARESAHCSNPKCRGKDRTYPPAPTARWNA